MASAASLATATPPRPQMDRLADIGDLVVRKDREGRQVSRAVSLLNGRQALDCPERCDVFRRIDSRTPSIADASAASMERMIAWAWGERNTAVRRTFDEQVIGEEAFAGQQAWVLQPIYRLPNSNFGKLQFTPMDGCGANVSAHCAFGAAAGFGVAFREIAVNRHAWKLADNDPRAILPSA